MGWQDAPLVGGGSWSSAPLVGENQAPDDAKRKLAEATSGGDAFTIGAGRMGDRLFEGLKQSGLGIGAILSELVLVPRLKTAMQDGITKLLLEQEKRMAAKAKDDASEYKKLEDAHPIATATGEAAPLIAAPMLRVAAGPGAGAVALNSAASAAIPAAIEYGTAEEKAKRATLSFAAGAVGSGVTSAAAKVFSGITKSLTPEAQRLAALAERKFNIPLDAAQKTGNKALQTVNSVMESMPATASKEAAKQRVQRDALTREVMKTLGESTDEATSATWSAAKARIGGDFERIFGKAHVNLDDDAVQAGLAKVVQDATETLPQESAAVVVKRVGQLLDKIDDNGAVAGKAYQAWRSSVQKQAKDTNDRYLGGQLKNLYKTVDEAAYKAAADVGEDGALRTARDQYRNLKIIEPLVAKSEDGVIPSKLLREEVRKHVPDFAAGGGGDIAELAKIARKFVADQVPNSGTPQRQLAQALVTGGAVGGGTFALTDDPTKALAYGAGAVALPRAVQSALNSGPVQRYLGEGGPGLNPLLQALMDRAARVGALGYVRSGSE